ncbi:hypothetical protein [Actinomycetospora straminea]|uniref:Uncharacterized protein n=1 Tax=Actinomycetospora straminea TaxID=663607 RepID=A0ABP9E1R2_9PSEU|nr:hypothetical protein [Actinomycetospora straminea]MDD7931254.1 hypothetical protein [Actinomycetospora straminea]
MDSVPPVHGPARGLDDVLAELGGGPDDVPDDADHTDHTDHTDTDDGPPPDLPEVVEAVSGRARDLHRLADRLGGDDATTGGLSAVALLRAHAGAVGDLAEHLLAAGGGHADGTPGTAAADADGPEDAGPGPRPAAARGVPRSVG